MGLAARRVVGVFALLFVVACGKSSPAPGNPFESQARTVVDDLAGGRFLRVENKFDPTMSSQLSSVQLSNNWRTYQEAVGTYKSTDNVALVKQGDLSVERVTITTSTGTGEVRITYHPDGTIAGLYFLNTGAPPP
jgi:hypothetical protein